MTTNEISRNVTEAAKASADIAQNITGVAQAAEQTARGAGESQQAAQGLARMAAELQRLVSHFRYRGGDEEAGEELVVRPSALAAGRSGANGHGRAPAGAGR